MPVLLTRLWNGCIMPAQWYGGFIYVPRMLAILFLRPLFVRPWIARVR